MIVGVETKIDSAHYLPKHAGKCKNLHGHTWHIIVEVMGPIDSNTGMITDFSSLRETIKEITDPLDHKLLNDLLNFTPTCENLALYLKDCLSKRGWKVHSVYIREGEGGYAIA